jgi:hypothetical protein
VVVGAGAHGDMVAVQVVNRLLQPEGLVQREQVVVDGVDCLLEDLDGALVRSPAETGDGGDFEGSLPDELTESSDALGRVFFGRNR